MDNVVQSSRPEILRLIGAIVLSTQDAERLLKTILPFTDSGEPSIQGVMLRHEKLRKRTFGTLVKELRVSVTSESDAFADHLSALVERRNKIVHHFRETFGTQMLAGNVQGVVQSLQAQLINVEALRDALAQLALQLFEALRDRSFQGTPEFKEMDELCAAFRQQIAS